MQPLAVVRVLGWVNSVQSSHCPPISYRAVDEEGAEDDDAEKQRAGGTDHLKPVKELVSYHIWMWMELESSLI